MLLSEMLDEAADVSGLEVVDGGRTTLTLLEIE